MPFIELTSVSGKRLYISSDQIIAVRSPFKGEYEDSVVKTVIITDASNFGVLENPESIIKVIPR